MDKVRNFKKTGLCFKNISYEEICDCMYWSEDFIEKNLEDIHFNFEGNSILLKVTKTKQKLIMEGMITIYFFDGKTDETPIGWMKMCKNKNVLFVGNIQTEKDQKVLNILSKRKYKTPVIRFMLKSFISFCKNIGIESMVFTSTKNRCFPIEDIDDVLVTDYDSLFKSFDFIPSNDRWTKLL